jgi:hypothetical protein
MAEQLQDALRLMREAMVLLDAAGEDVVAAHLDLAIQRLIEIVGHDSARRMR